MDDDDLEFLNAEVKMSPTLPSSTEVITPVRSNTIQFEFFEPTEITRPELNLAKYASMIFMSPYAKGTYEIREYDWKVQYEGEDVTAKITVHPAKDLKSYTTTTYKVFLALVQIWEQQGRDPRGEIVFSARQLAHLLQWKWAGATGKRIQEQIEILKKCSLSWNWSFQERGKRKDVVYDMHILGDGTAYRERSTRLKSKRFDAIHKVRFGEFILKNLNQGYTKPINYHTYISIGHETAANLYTHLDLVMANKKIPWRRRAHNLIFKDLKLTGQRYEQKKHRHALLKRLVEELNGKATAYGRLVLTIESTADREDYNLVCNVKRTPAARIAPPPKLANPEHLIPVIVDELISEIRHIPCSYPTEPSRGFIEMLVRWYSEKMLREALAIVKADYHGKIRSSPVKAFVAQVHIEAHNRNLKWVKPCKPSIKACRYNGRTPFFEKLAVNDVE